MSRRIAFFYLSAVAAAAGLTLVAGAAEWTMSTTILILMACATPLGVAAVASVEGIGGRDESSRRSVFAVTPLVAGVLALAVCLVAGTRTPGLTFAAIVLGLLFLWSIARFALRSDPFREGVSSTITPSRVPSGHFGLLAPSRAEREAVVSPAWCMAFRSVDARVVLAVIDGQPGVDRHLVFVRPGIPTLCLEPADEETAPELPVSEHEGHTTVVRYENPTEVREFVERWMITRERLHALDRVGFDAPGPANVQVVLYCHTRASRTMPLVHAELAALQLATSAESWGAATVVDLLTNVGRGLSRARIRRRRLDAARDWVRLEQQLHPQVAARRAR